MISCLFVLNQLKPSVTLTSPTDGVDFSPEKILVTIRVDALAPDSVTLPAV